MLVRVLIVGDADLERRLDRIFESLEIAVATAPHKAVLWDRVKAFPADLVIIGRSFLPDPIEGTVETIQALPERPEVIVVSENEHAEDIPKLAERYLDDFRVRLSSNVASFSQEAMLAMVRYPWPGNIRELINVVERSVLLCDGEQITLDDLPRTIVPGPHCRGDAKSSSSLDAMFESEWRSQPWKDVRDAVVCASPHTDDWVSILNRRATVAVAFIGIRSAHSFSPD